MVELQDIPFALDAEALMRAQRIKPGSDAAEAFGELLAKVVDVARPKALYDVCYIEEKAADSVVLNGVRLTSRALRRNLDPVERVFPFVATCGTEVDALTTPKGHPVQDFWLWSVKEALLGAATEHLYDHLSGRHRMSHWGMMQPGSGDADVWPIEQQRPLFSLLGDVEGRIGVRLTDSMLMVPTMSESGVVFPAEADFASCQVCRREECPRRTAPFDEAVWRELCDD